MGSESNGLIRFGDYELDSLSGKLSRGGLTVKIQPQPLRVLCLLLEQPGKIVSREYLRERIWGDAIFVEFDQGLNYAIRQIRLALGESATEPVHIETLPKLGYRFVAPVSPISNGQEVPAPSESVVERRRDPLPGKGWRRLAWISGAVIGLVLTIISITLHPAADQRPRKVEYAQLTDFTDSAVSPTLSPDGRMVAFIRGPEPFFSADAIDLKVLPNGETKRLTDDPRPKYSLTFSPDGSQVAYTVLDRHMWDTYTIPVSGGEPHRFLTNAAGLRWLDEHQLLYSEVRSGVHMGVVTGTATRENFRELYFPAHERGMAHYSYSSPDRKWALVVEMLGTGAWGPCRLISLGAPSGTPVPSRSIGPEGACTSAGWSPDGRWMYFTATVEGGSHLWRQRFAGGPAEQITFGPTDEDGIAMDHDGRSLITSVSVRASAVWIHDNAGDRSLSSEGEVIARPPPIFSGDSRRLYYLLRHQTSGAEPELWRTDVALRKSEAVLPSRPMIDFDISPDEKQVVYSTAGRAGKTSVWLASLEGSARPRQIGVSGETSPRFGPPGRIVFRLTEGNHNYLGQMNTDGSGRSRVVPFEISEIEGISPGRRWVVAIAPTPGGRDEEVVAIPTAGGSPVRLCQTYCKSAWSVNGKFLFISVEDSSTTNPGRSLAIPIGPGENLLNLPPEGIAPSAEAADVPGARNVARSRVVPGNDPDHFAYIIASVHSNLYRLTLP